MTIVPRSCFEAYATHKFRSSLGKRKGILTPGQSVAVALGDGAASYALLHFVHTAVSSLSNKRLRITPVFITVDSEPRIVDME